MEIDREVDAIKKGTTAKKMKSCGVVQGTARKEGDTWQKDVCTRCSCKVSPSDFFHLVVLYLTVHQLDTINELTICKGPRVVFLS